MPATRTPTLPGAALVEVLLYTYPALVTVSAIALRAAGRVAPTMPSARGGSVETVVSPRRFTGGGPRAILRMRAVYTRIAPCPRRRAFHETVPELWPAGHGQRR